MQSFSRKYLIVLFFLFHLDLSANDIYEFKDSYQEQRFFSLIDEIRCPKCTSGSLASSDAPVSKDLKDRIYFMILDEKSDQEIKDFVIQRYGKQSDYNPSFSENLFLWLMPLIFFISFIIFFGLKKGFRLLYLVFGISLIPILFYLFSRGVSHKSVVLLSASLIYGFIYFSYFSSYQIIGSHREVKLINSIDSQIFENTDVSFEVLAEVSKLQSQELSFLYIAKKANEAISNNSLISAESLLKFINQNFKEEEFQVDTFNLLADLRDTKYPEYSQASVLINFNLIDEPKCINGIIDTQVFLKNGPLVPLAVSSDSLSDIKNNNLMLDKTNAVVRGFDIPSAALNKEITSIVVELKCSDGTYDYESNINFSKPIEAAPWQVNISDSEWSKREQ